MDDISKFEITNRTEGKANKRSLVDVDKYVNEITRAVKAVIGKDTFFKIGDKHIDPNGNLNIKVYVASDYESNAQTAIDRVTGKWNVNHKRSGFKRDEPTSVDKNEVERNTEDVKNEARERKESERTTHALFTKVLAVTTLIADITRRILSSVINASSKALAEGREAGDYGMSYSDVRKYRIMEKTYGIEEGTSVNAISDIQSKFGNIVHLDENALADLALVMGSNIIDLINTGMGGDNPDKLMEEILNSYFKTAMSGYNSIGQYVGQDQARRELVEQLKKISPELSKMLSAMLEANLNPASIYYGTIDGFGSFKNGVPTNWMGLTDAELSVFRTFGDYANELQATWASIKEGIQIKVADRLLRALESIAQNPSFMSSEQRIEQSLKNKKENEKTKEDLIKQRNAIDSKYRGTVERASDSTSNYLVRGMSLSQLYRVGVRGDTLTAEEKASLGLTGKKDKEIRKQAFSVFAELWGANYSVEDFAKSVGIEDSINKIDELNSQEMDITKYHVDEGTLRYEGSEKVMKAMFDGKSWNELSPYAKKRLYEGFSKYVENGALNLDTFKQRQVTTIGQDTALAIEEEARRRYELDPEKTFFGKTKSWLTLGEDKKQSYINDVKDDKDFVRKLEEEVLVKALYESANAPILGGSLLGAQYDELASLILEAILESVRKDIQTMPNNSSLKSNGEGHSSLDIKIHTDDGLKADITTKGDITFNNDYSLGMTYAQSGGLV